jgi:rubrerythrin
VLTPTSTDLASTKPAPMTAVPPTGTISDDTLARIVAGGLNPAYVTDLFSAFLTHERCGRHLYRSVAGRTNNPVLKARYVEFGEETERHVAIYEQLIEAMGGDPAYVSPMARSVELADAKTLEATFLLAGSADIMVLESTMLDAVFLAEAMCHANWQAVGALAARMDEGPVRDALMTAHGEVEAEEDHHLQWASDMRAKLVMLQADHSTAANMAQKAEEMVATIKGWFTGSDTA